MIFYNHFIRINIFFFVLYRMYLTLSDIQPSQLYLNSEKLVKVLNTFAPNSIALPVIELNGEFVFTDGHTRAFAEHLNGTIEIEVYTDKEDINLESYQICVDWCKKEGITSISHLKKRIVSPADYKILWLEKCKLMHTQLGII
jgi:hypothetical protein